MAIKIMATRVCDRCSKCIGQEAIQPDFAGKLPQVQPTRFQIVREHLENEVAVSEKTEVLASFRDLCQSCEGAINNLVQRILMREPAATTAETPATDGAAPAAPATRRGKRSDKVALDNLDPKAETASATATGATTPTAETPATPATPAPTSEPPSVPGEGVEFPPDPTGKEDPDQPF